MYKFEACSKRANAGVNRQMLESTNGNKQIVFSPFKNLIKFAE